MFEVETGWLNFGLIQGMQLIHRVILLAETRGLKKIDLEVSIDYENNFRQPISFIPGPTALQTSYAPLKKQFRFDFRENEVRAMKLKWIISAEYVRLISMLFTIGVDEELAGQSYIHN